MLFCAVGYSLTFYYSTIALHLCSDFFNLKTTYSYIIYEKTAHLPEGWDELARSNIFLSQRYLKILEDAPPQNMKCFFIGVFDQSQLIGIALSQFLNLNLLETFGERDRCIKTSIRNFMFKKFCSHVLFIGNNMLTGQNAFAFEINANKTLVIQTLFEVSLELKHKLKKAGLPVHITTFKDFEKDDLTHFPSDNFEALYLFSTQPNMIFCSCNEWHNFEDYLNALSKKYRDQYKRCRKKGDGIQKRKLNLEEIHHLEDTIYDLYHHVAQNAPFNTFFLPKNHFKVMKKNLKDDFLFYGYFDNQKLIGFNTLIKNGFQMDTYFLGYNESIQREKMLYLNMLYDMIAYSINKGFKEIVFARTALEIKSSVGAKPQEMFGFIEHSNSFINRRMKQLFCYLEPKTEWKERNPFK